MNSMRMFHNSMQHSVGGPILTRRDNNTIVVEDEGKPLWNIRMNDDRTEFSASKPQSSKFTSGQTGPEFNAYVNARGVTAIGPNCDDTYAMSLKPDQYEWAGLTTVGSMINVPVALLLAASASVPQA